MIDRLCRILIVDDSAEDRAAYRRQIAGDKSHAYTILETALGEEGLEVCRREKPDCILLDYNLPDLNGLEFIERLRKADGSSPIPVVMLTGQGNEAVAVEALERGAQDYLVKQLSGNDLRHVIRRAIDGVALSTEREEARREIQRLADERIGLIQQLERQTIELRETGHRKDEFLAVLAHELRNPLGPIRNAARILTHEDTTESSHAHARQVIERQVSHMGRLIDDLLDVSRIGRGKVLLRRERLDLTGLARAAAEDHRPGIETAGQTLVLDLPDAPAWVDGDPTRLAQIIGNLLHNAGKFTGAGGSITLSVQCSAETAAVAVSDTGIGMSPGVLAHAFESFNQADQTLDRSRGGLGLGLALSKGLVELHGGHVHAQSEGEGKGSRVSFIIPRGLAPAAAKTAPPSAGPASSWRVLVIEDNVDAAKTLAALLRIYGHKPRVAHCGAQGIEAAHEFDPDVVLCDIGLPGGMDGYGVAQALRGEPRLRRAYLVAVTGYAQEEDIQQARASGFDLHLTKPVDPARLQSLLAALPAQKEV